MEGSREGGSLGIMPSELAGGRAGAGEEGCRLCLVGVVSFDVK